MGVEFNEDSGLDRSRYYERVSEPKGLVKFFINLGWAKNEKDANVIMVAITVIALALTAYVIFK